MRFVSGLIAAFALALTSTAWAQSHNLGPAVGSTIPAISALDQTGASRSLSSLSGENGIVLSVTRAADWCPYCQAQMIGLEGARTQIEQRGYHIVTISTDTVEELAQFQRRRNIGYTMLSDEQAQIVGQLDLLDPTQPPNRRHNGLPVPTILVLSPTGHVLAKLGDADYRVRPAPGAVLASRDGLR